MKFNITEFFKRNWVHFFALGLFFVITLAYFSPQFGGNGLKQHDIEQFIGMSHETVEYRAENGEEPLWTNSMFGGMPTYQISTAYEGNMLTQVKRILGLWLGSPAGIFLTYLTGFYIMLLCFRTNKWVAILGALAFAFSSYYIIILQAGHNSKAMAIALAPPVIGAFYMAFRNNLKWGILLSALFMGMEISANHLQITYYLGIVLIFMGIVELVRAFGKQSNFKRFGFATLGVLVAYGFALGINYGNISFTNDYAKYTIRGANDIKINPDGTTAANNQSKGLDKDYITQWSYGIGESMTLISPYINGGGTAVIGNSPFKDKLKSKEYRNDAPELSKQMMYWGDQPIVTGPVYLGIIVVFLALLALVFVKDRIKWALLAATILCLMLSWGKNYMGLTEFFIDNIPGYNKFRAVTIILAIVEICVPLLGVLFLQKLIQEREAIKAQMKTFYIVSGASALLLLIFAFAGTGDDYLSERESEFLYGMEANVRSQIESIPVAQAKEQYGVDLNNPQQKQAFIQNVVENQSKSFDAVVDFRADIAKMSYLRSFGFLLVAAFIIFAFLKWEIKTELLIGALAIVILADLVPVDRIYLNSEKERGEMKFWMPEFEKVNPFYPNRADQQIMQNEIAQNPELQKVIDEAAKKAEDKDLRREKGYANYIEGKKFAALNAHTNYRVYEPSGGTNSSRASYFHKSMGGYHGAKLRNIQNIYNFQLSQGNYKIFDMFNVKYFIQQNQQTGEYQAQPNPNALGNAWLVSEFQVEETPEEEIRALGKEVKITNKGNGTLVVNNEVVTDALVYGAEKIQYVNKGDSMNINIQTTLQTGQASSFVADINGRGNWVPNFTLEMDTTNSFEVLVTQEVVDNFMPRTEAIITPSTYEKVKDKKITGEGTITMTSYAPNELHYAINTSGDQFAVFSEIYYPDGWNAYLDGKQVDIEKTNYLLRGVFLPAGAKELVMKFEVPSFDTVNTVSFVLSLFLLLLIVFFFIKDLKDKKWA
ncbi:membrane protein YfhO [Lishizhenia tianjinensis]|uniref:Membrane protein YfhO n=1 Tax=Lishizhenia tianjinensis TaxID=477690 RepID=A0A1I6YJ63_9FLAO|nr:YfhO family protein [Lishizhenia tianjinensis]SFT50398.1 membrane protein YfhO [Lishizhenia tianjinensis]